MHNDLIKLVKIQQLDSEISATSLRMEKLPVEVNLWRERFNNDYRDNENNKENLKKLRLSLKTTENDLVVIEDKLEQLNDRIYRVKTQKELESVDHEIKFSKNKKGELEETIIMLMEEIDALDKRIKETDKRIADERVKLEREENIISGKIKGEEKILNEKKSVRESLLSSLRVDLQTQYMRLLDTRDGRAIAPIMGDNCGGCQQILPLEISIKAKSGNSIVHCNHCARILYSEDEFQKTT